MKTLLTVSAVVVTGVMAAKAYASFTATQLVDVTKLAVEAFESDNPDHAVHFTGFKSWKSGEDARVRIYVDHDGHAMEFNYLCHSHDGETECHAQ